MEFPASKKPIIRLIFRGNGRPGQESQKSPSITDHTFFGTTISNLPLDIEIEHRKLKNHSVTIGKTSNVWKYIIDSDEHYLRQADKDAVESIINRLPDSPEIDTSTLLKDQRLAGEIIGNHVNSKFHGRLTDAECDLADIVSRYAVGYGPLELILSDPAIEDVLITSPSGNNPICVSTRLNSSTKGSIYCETNLKLSENYVRSIIAKTRIFHGGELSVSKPILEIDLPHLKARMSAAILPASRHGASISIRRRRDHLWSLPRLIAEGSISWTAAGFLSICCAARASIIIAGGRGSGKTTLLSALLPEMPSNGRTIIMEDTEELPVLQLQNEGLSIQSLSLSGGIEKASSVMRAALRMGEGPIIVGEIRGEESRILFESIRTGTAGSCVIGTLHASDANSVRNRIVIDMKMNPESFQSINLIVIVSQTKDPLTGIYRRYVSKMDLVSAEGCATSLFGVDDSGILRTNFHVIKEFGELGDKICSHLGTTEDRILSASRTRGFLKKVQAAEWVETGNDRILSVRTTQAINGIPLDMCKSPDLNSLRETTLAAIHGCIDV